MLEVTVGTFAESPNVERALDVLEVEGGRQHPRHLPAYFLLEPRDVQDLVFIEHFFDFFLKYYFRHFFDFFSAVLGFLMV